MQQVENLKTETEVQPTTPIALIPAEQRVVMSDITWEMYEGLSSSQNKSVPRFTYDRGLLEIMSPSSEHEEIKDSTVFIVRMWGIEKRIKIRSFGSTTFRREILNVVLNQIIVFTSSLLIS